MRSSHDLTAMRIAFDGGRGDILCDQEQVRIGSAPNCDVVLPAADACAHHLAIIRDRRGLVLQVAADATHVYVNARPVREQALMRLGDVLSVGRCKLTLKQARDDFGEPQPQHKAPTLPAGLVSLRVIAGPLAGKRLAIDDELLLDGLMLPACVGCVRLHRGRGAIDFAVLGPLDARPPSFNGVQVTNGRLHVGDQIAWRGHRLVVEAPGLVLVEDHVRFVPPEEPLPEETAGPSNEVWWLIVTAAILALGIALLLVLRF